MRIVKILLMSLLLLAGGSGAGAAVDFSGSWVGQYENNSGETGEDRLYLSWTGGGYTGTWGKIQVSAREVNANTIEIWGSTDKRSYQGTGTLEGGYLTINYNASRLDQGGSYQGRSVLWRP